MCLEEDENKAGKGSVMTREGAAVRGMKGGGMVQEGRGRRLGVCWAREGKEEVEGDKLSVSVVVSLVSRVLVFVTV